MIRGRRKAAFAEHAKVEKRETKAWQDVDEELGEHMTLGAIVVLFGGWTWQPAVVGAKRLAATCAKLGQPWIIEDYMSGLTMYLVLRRRSRHLLKQSWEMFEEHYNKDELAAARGDDKAKMEGSGTASAGGPKTPATAAGGTSGTPKGMDSKGEDKELPDGKSTAAGGHTPPPKTEAKEGLEQALTKEASKVKAQLLKHRSMAKTLIEAIHCEPEWDWANNAPNVGDLEFKLGALDGGIAKSPFNSALLINDPKSMKNRAGASFQVGLAEFNKLLEPVGIVQDAISCLMQQHNCKLALRRRRAA